MSLSTSVNNLLTHPHIAYSSSAIDRVPHLQQRNLFSDRDP
ncbi:MAG: hypothetical protein WA882_10885 [Geitlerinemataceae cyanobacterium]